MTVLSATLQAMEEILGLEEMEDQLDLNLWENNLVDSLSVVTLIGRIEELTGTAIHLKDMKASDFVCIRSLTDAIGRKAKPVRT